MRFLVALALAALLALVPNVAPAPESRAGGGGAALGASPTELLTSVVEPTEFGAVTTINAYSGEPNIAVGPDGTTYVTGLDWAGTMVLRRLPGAASFTYLGQPNFPYGGNDEALAVAPDGTVWISGMYGFFSGGGACSSMTASRDRGTSWAPTTANICELRQGIDRQWIAVDGDGIPWVVQHEICCSGQHFAYRSTDGGVTFDVAGVTIVNGAFPGNLFVDRAGNRIYETTSCTVAGYKQGPCVLATSTTLPTPVWEVHPVARYTTVPPGLAHIAGAADDAGNLYVAWVDRGLLEARMGTFVARSTDGGFTWSLPQRVSGPGLATMPWIAAGADGNVAVVWFETPIGTDPNFATGSWHVMSATIKGWTGATMPTPKLTQLSSTPAKTGAICTTGASCTGNRELLDFFEATVGPDGKLHVVWPDANAWRLRVAEVDAGLR